MQRLECRKLFEGCEAVVEAETTDEVLRQAAEHARDVHGLEEVDPATEQAIRSGIESR